MRDDPERVFRDPTDRSGGPYTGNSKCRVLSVRDSSIEFGEFGSIPRTTSAISI
jgi:hypothetical protein